MKQTKRLLCLVLSLIMLLSQLPTAALAADLTGADESNNTVGDDAPGVPETVSPAGEGAERSEAGAQDLAEVAAPGVSSGDSVILNASEESMYDDELDDGDEILRFAQDDEDAPTPVRVTFVCDPEETVVTVYDPVQPDENGEPTVIDPEEDGSWLLVPGTYLYDAECEGYEAVEKEAFTVEAGQEQSVQTVALTTIEIVADGVPEIVSDCEGLAAAARAKESSKEAASNNGNRIIVQTTSQVQSLLDSWEPHFNGKYWNGFDRNIYGNNGSTDKLIQLADSGLLNSPSVTDEELGITSFPCDGNQQSNGCRSNYFKGASQCFGFAKWITYALFAETPSSSNWETFSGSKLENFQFQPGDYINSDSHGAVVWKVGGSTVYVAQVYGNNGCKIKWGAFSTGGKAYSSSSSLIDLLVSRENVGACVRRIKSFDYNIQQYLDQCSSEPCNVVLTVTVAGNMKTMPCRKDTNPLSETVETLVVGNTYSSTVQWTNTAGNIWYEVTSSTGQRGFIYSGDVSVSNPTSTLSISVPAANHSARTGMPSGSLTKGKSWGLRGTISSNFQLTKIECHVYNPSGGDAVTAYKNTNPNTKTYNIQSDGMNDAISFKNLPVGNNYKIVISAQDSSGAYKEVTSYFNIDSSDPPTPETYTISYDANGGTGAPANQTKTQGQTLYLSSTTPTRTGYTFLGWAWNQYAVSGGWQPGGAYNEDGDATLFAIWTPNLLVMQYNSNGGDIGQNDYFFSQDGNGNILRDGSTTINTWSYGETVDSGLMNAGSFALSREGYAFVGWCLNADGSSTVYDQDEPLAPETISPALQYGSTSVTFFAIWKANTYPNTWTNTGNQAVDLAEVAYTQVGYTETDSNHTKYNQWYYGSDTSAAWCAIFVSWCADQAGISQSIIHRTTYAYPGSDDFNVPYYSFSDATPAKGDLIFVENNGNLNYGDVYGFDHVGIVYKVEGNTIYTVEGNDNDQVTYNRYFLSSGVDEDNSSAYICWIGKPNYNTSSSGGSYTLTGAGGVSTKLNEVLSSYPNGSKWTDSFDGGKQCYGFAKLVVYLVFGKNANGNYRSWKYNGTSSSGMQIISQVEECTESKIRTLLSQARPGDVLQFDTGNTSGHQHSMVVYSLDSTGATIYECNWTKDTVTLNHLSFSALANRQTRPDGTKRGTLSLLRADNYETVNGSTSTESTLQLSNANGPSGHYDSLDHFGLRGTFTSNYTITTVEAFVQNSAGTKVLSYNKLWNSTTYSIQNDGLNSAFSFGTLPQNDSYTYRVKATDASGKTCSFESRFSIGNTAVISGSVQDRLAQVLAQYPDGSTWTESFDNSTQSYGFAGMVIYNVFGNSTVSGKTYRWWKYDGTSTSGMNLAGQVTTCTESRIQQLLSQARPGDVLQFNSGSNGEKQFSMIVYDLLYDNGTVIGARIYDCNWGDSTNSCVVHLSALSNAQLAARQGGRGALSLLTSDNWESINGGAYQRPTPRYAVVYDGNGGINAPDNQTKVQGIALSLPDTTPTRADSYIGVYRVAFDTCGGEADALYLDAERISSYSFANWNTAQNGSGTTYSPGATYTADAPVTLYAQWTETTTTVSIDLPTPTRSGYSFQGWATSSTATSGTTGSYTPTGNVTLYATWKADTYTITYDANGGTGAPANQTKTHDQTLTLSSTAPTRADASAGSYTVTLNANGGSVNPTSLTAARTTKYTFKNWNTAQNGSGTSYNPGASYTANAAATLYAQWNSNTTTSAVTLPTPTREGYTFLGWAESSNASEGITGSYTTNGDVTLYAIWKQDISLEDVPQFCVADVTGHAGGTITVPVTIKNNPGIAMFKVNVEYDANILEWTGVSHKALDGFWSAGAGMAIVWIGDGETEYREDGEIFTLQFKVKENVEAEGTSISLSYDPDDIQTWNEVLANYENVFFAVTDGKVSVRSTSTLSGTVLSWSTNGTASNAEVFLYATSTEDASLLAAAQSGDYSGATAAAMLGAVSVAGKQESRTFTFSDVEPGSYKLLVMRPGKYIPHIQSVELTEDTDLGEISLWLYGDVTNDGKVNGTDALQIKRYFAGISSLFDRDTEQDKAVRLVAANVTAPRSGDDKVNGTDALQIQRYFAGIPSVYDYMR